MPLIIQVCLISVIVTGVFRTVVDGFILGRRRVWHSVCGHRPLKVEGTERTTLSGYSYTVYDIECDCGFRFNDWGITTHYANGYRQETHTDG